MRIGIIFPPSPFNITLPHIVKFLSEWYSKAMEEKMKVRKEEFGIDKLKTSPSWGYRIPPTISYISSQLKKIGYRPKLFHIDFLLSKKLTIDEICRRIANSVDCAIFLTSTAQYNSALEILGKIKAISPEILTILAGREATFLTRKVLLDGFDIAVKGEIEAVLPHLIRTLEIPSCKVECIHRQKKGIGVRLTNEKIKITKGVNKVDINELPLPDFSIFPEMLRKHANISWQTSRGCPFKCAYCYEPFFWNPLRFKRLEKIKEELELYKKFFPFNHVFFHDSTFNFGNWKEVIQMVRNELDLYFSFNLRLDLLKRKDLEFLRINEPIAIFSGIETSSVRVLNRLNRYQNLSYALKVASKVNSICPFLTLSFIIGLPYETVATIMKTKKLIAKLLTKDKIFQVSVRLFTPYPGTPCFHAPRKYGIKILSYEFERYDRYSFPPVIRTNKIDEFTLYYLFLDIYSMIVKLNLQMTGFNLKEFEEDLFEKVNIYSPNVYKLKYG